MATHSPHRRALRRRSRGAGVLSHAAQLRLARCAPVAPRRASSSETRPRRRSACSRATPTPCARTAAGGHPRPAVLPLVLVRWLASWAAVATRGRCSMRWSSRIRVDLYPDAIAQCIFESAPLSSCQPPSAWESLWPAMEERIQDFLSALEAHAGTPELATRASTQLKRMVLTASPRWSPVVSDLERAPG